MARQSPSTRSHNIYRNVRGKVVDQIEHEFEEGLLYLHIRFIDKTELCWRIASTMTIEKADLSDWKSGNLEPLAVFVRDKRTPTNKTTTRYASQTRLKRPGGDQR